jgi:PadR family transcriptional regulator PadR
MYVEHINTWKTEKNNMFTNNCQKEVRAKLAKGLLDMIVLQILDQEPMHGYQLIGKIRKNFGVNFGASTIYPFLERLEKKGYLKSEWNLNAQRPQKVFSLTNDGRSVLTFAENSLMLIKHSLMSEKLQEPREQTISLVQPSRH